MDRFHPQWDLARRLVSEGKIGQVRTFIHSFRNYIDDPQSPQQACNLAVGSDRYRMLLDFVITFILAQSLAVLGIVEYIPVQTCFALPQGYS